MSDKFSLRHNFIEIIRSNSRFYGGNQLWYDDGIAKNSACGSIAATNILLYLAMTDNRFKAIFDIDQKVSSGIELDYSSYKIYMHEVYRFIHPINISYQRKDKDSFYNFMKMLKISDLSLGIPTARLFINGVLAFAKTKNINLGVCKFSDKWTKDNVIDFLKLAFAKDKPVALLNGFNKKLKMLEYFDENGVSRRASFEKHWVVITGININKKTDKTFLEVSSWGEKIEIDLELILNNDPFRAMIYFI